ncbi:MAG: M48 family metalloprotease [Rhodobacterales bacterium]|nr:M48 family metalloprotease [Rhodobacterales bacterium]
MARMRKILWGRILIHLLFFALGTYQLATSWYLGWIMARASGAPVETVRVIDFHEGLDWSLATTGHWIKAVAPDDTFPLSVAVTGKTFGRLRTGDTLDVQWVGLPDMPYAEAAWITSLEPVWRLGSRADGWAVTRAFVVGLGLVLFTGYRLVFWRRSLTRMQALNPEIGYWQRRRNRNEQTERPPPPWVAPPIDPKYEALVTRLEAMARDHPARYARRVRAWALLGSLYLLFLFLVLAGSLTGMAYIIWTFQYWSLLFLVLPLGAASLLAGRVLLVRLPTPSGYVLNRADAPNFFHLIHMACLPQHGVFIEKIVLTDEFNAGVAQVPLLGLFGRHRNWLVLGLPFMAALELDEFIAVIGHEYGHLARRHGISGAWIYRARKAWWSVGERISDQSAWQRILFGRFLAWYGPFFNAYSFALARQQEYQADRMAAELTSDATAARALCAVYLLGNRYNEQYWEEIWSLPESEDRPQPGPHARMVAWLEEARRLWGDDLDRAMKARTGHRDTHPALRDRLAALGQDPMLPTPLERPAIEALPDDVRQAALSAYDDAWWAEAEAPWRANRQQLEQRQRDLADLKARQGAWTPEEDRWTLAQLTADLEGQAAAEPLFRSLVTAHPDDPRYQFALGDCLAAQDKEEGIAFLERSMAQDPEAIIPACDEAIAFLLRKGRENEAEAFWGRRQDREDQIAAADEERWSLHAGSLDLRPHGLPPETVQALREAASRRIEIKRAWVVRQNVRLMPERPFILIGLRMDLVTRALDLGDDIIEGLFDHVELPGLCVVMIEQRDRRWLFNPMRRVPGALFYRKGRPAIRD